MTSRIFRSILIVAVFVMLSGGILFTTCLYESLGNIQEDRLRNELHLAALGTESSGLAYLRRISPLNRRFTWIDASGRVLFDTEHRADLLESHEAREEFQQAVQTGMGRSIRYSATMMRRTIYETLRLRDGTILRISISHETLWALFLSMVWSGAPIGLIVFFLSYLLAKRVAVRIVSPLNTLDLEHPLINQAYDEIKPLLQRIASQHDQIRRQLHEIKTKRDEFMKITEHMKEGLILLSMGKRILHCNSAAQRFFHHSGDVIGQSLFSVDRGEELVMAFERAAADGYGEVVGERGDREYCFRFSQIGTRDHPCGMVMLILDTTDQTLAERSRREFTANVSHELKTPLHSIIGRAELLENGLVRPEDVAGFAGNIRIEAIRLVAVIEDIMLLSRLDESIEMPIDRIDLAVLTQNVLHDLQKQAEELHVCLMPVKGRGNVTGSSRLIIEIIRNLCENAVKYNRAGGTVCVSIEETERETILQVEDTGIGIAEDDQKRVFERFYRVDKSRSRRIGGTGLGLSIVRHAVRYHHGTVELSSRMNQGTCVTVRFPKMTDAD
ncbi:MAG: ATP-binding protein [Desulfovibrionaceae bacterium]|nr:ATP-binding protein [Desulfovibrionaceae bacterium]